MYAADEKWDSVKKVRMKMKALGIAKKLRFSIVEINCNIHEFAAGDTSHIYSEQIYEVLDQLSAELNLYGRMKAFKYDVMNKAHPEGCIAHTYLLQETLTYCIEYKGLRNLNILIKLEKSLNGSLSAPPDLLNVIDYNENDDEGGLVGSSQEFIIEGIEYEQARMWVLKSYPCYDTWKREHDNFIKLRKLAMGKRLGQYKILSEEELIPWLKKLVHLKVLQITKNVDINFTDIVKGPSYYANWESYINEEQIFHHPEDIIVEESPKKLSFMDHPMHLLDFDLAVADTAGNIPSHSLSSSRRRGPSRGSKPLPDRKKKKVEVNSLGQPIRGVSSYSTTIGTLTRNHIPINYKKFTNVPDEFIHIMEAELELICYI
ncbi:hypothetical protein GIB67_042576 [Kingdonia uniflora]|uniref:Uncharacterized protein n=1 Tax=Kingdonia uniflora TaxID=39325 RepID=A0A7J7M191_9MAGN|nr:hypothetical protein GIB67_042576 [Kingdonia uniflora]